MRMGQEHVFDHGRGYGKLCLLKFVFSLLHAVIHQEIAPVHPFDERAAARDLVRRADESDLHDPKALSEL